jgi:hypothetical protein
MNGRYLFAVILLVSLTAGVAAADVSGQPDLSATLSANQVEAGEDVTLTVTVSNAGHLVEGSTRNPALNNRVTVARSVQLGLTRGSAPLTIESGRQLVGSLPQGASAPITYDVSVDEDATPGRYQLPLTANYRYTSFIDVSDDDFVVRSGTASLGVDVVVEPGAQFALSDVDSALQAGQDGDVTGTITNSGTEPATDLVLTYASEKQNIAPLEREVAIGRLEPGESAPFRVPLDVSENAEGGAKQFTFTTTYTNEDGDTLTGEDLTVQQDVRPDTEAFDIAVDSTTVPAGSSTTIEVTLTNNGTDAYDDISAKLFSDDPIGTNDDEAFVASLAPGESTTITFGISAGGGALAKAYPVSMDFQYDVRGDTVLSNTYRVPVTVAESDGGGGLPASPTVIGGAVAGAVVVLLVVVALYRRRS